MRAGRVRPVRSHAISRPRSASRARQAASVVCRAPAGAARARRAAARASARPRLASRPSVAAGMPPPGARPSGPGCSSVGSSSSARRRSGRSRARPSPPAGGPRRGSRRASPARPLGGFDDDVVGPLDPRALACVSSRGRVPLGPATSQTATAAISGSSGGGVAQHQRSSSELPAGADQRRPWRPRPAVCSEAVTSVPCGAPASASSRARSLVESVRRRCSRGRPSAWRSRWRRAGGWPLTLRRTISSSSASAPSSSAAEPRLTASASIRGRPRRAAARRA